MYHFSKSVLKMLYALVWAIIFVECVRSHDTPLWLCYNAPMNYKKPIPVAVAMIFNSDRSKVLVGERGIEPFIGGDAMLSGFTNEGETPSSCSARSQGRSRSQH